VPYKNNKTILHVDIENCFGKERKQPWSKKKVWALPREKR